MLATRLSIPLICDHQCTSLSELTSLDPMLPGQPVFPRGNFLAVSRAHACIIFLRICAKHMVVLISLPLDPDVARFFMSQPNIPDT